MKKLFCILFGHDWKVFPVLPYTQYDCRRCGLEVRG